MDYRLMLLFLMAIGYANTSKPSTGLKLPEKCRGARCTNRELVDMCYYNQHWRTNRYSGCYLVINPSPVNRFFRAMWNQVKRWDLHDKEFIWNCTVRDEWASTSGCKAMEALVPKVHRDRRPKQQVEYLVNFHLALKAAEECFYDGSWVSGPLNHQCRIIAGYAKPDMSLLQTYQNKAYMELIERDATDKAFVRHCFIYHQIIKSDACAPLIAGRPISWARSTYRQNRLTELWNFYQEKLDYCLLPEKMSSNDYCLRMFMDRNYTLQRAQMVKCLYSKGWQDDNTEECRTIVYGPVQPGNGTQTDLTSEELTLHRLYQAQAEINLVRDCYLHHRFDKFQPCYNISWNEQGATTPVKASHRAEWERLASDKYKEPKNYSDM